MRFSDKMRNLRIQRGLTQTQMAEDLGVSQSSIASYETERREPDFRTIRQIADYFSVPLSALLPSEDGVDEDYAFAESLHANPKLKLLFDRTRYFSDADLDAVLTIVNAISRERGD